MVIMEAMALGLPVISTHHTGIPELINNDETGILVPEKNVDALAKSLENLLSNIKVQGNYAIAGRKRIERDFNSKNLNDQLFSLYQGVLTQ